MVRYMLLVTCCGLALGSDVFGQYSPSLGPPSRDEAIDATLNRSGPLITYGGQIIYRFPQYDIAINGTPPFAGQGDGSDDPSDSRHSPTRVIIRTPTGSWDGSNFFLSPNYDNSYTYHFYQYRFVDSSLPTIADDGSVRSPFSMGSGVWNGRAYPAKPFAQAKEPPASSELRVTKSDATLSQLYQSMPSFRYAPTPLPPVKTVKPTLHRQPSTAPSRSASLDESQKSSKALLWQLDKHSFDQQDWTRRQQESTQRIRRRHRTTTSKTQSGKPQRLTPESNGTDSDSADKKSTRKNR